MKYLIVICLVIFGNINVLAQGGSRAIQPPDYCVAFPEDSKCKKDQPAPPVIETPKNSVQNINPTTEPSVEQKPVDTTPQIPKNIESSNPILIPNTKNDNVEKKIENSEKAVDKSVENKNELTTTSKKSENRVVIGMLKLFVYFYLLITGLGLTISAAISYLTRLRNHKNNLEKHDKIFRTPLIFLILATFGLVALFILQAL
jgi:hypothetical protein